jgi:hypothetical protein
MASMVRSVKNFALVAVVVGCSMAVSVSAQAPAPAPTSDAATTVPAFVAPVVASLLAFVAARMM